MSNIIIHIFANDNIIINIIVLIIILLILILIVIGWQSLKDKQLL